VSGETEEAGPAVPPAEEPVLQAAAAAARPEPTLARARTEMLEHLEAITEPIVAVLGV